MSARVHILTTSDNPFRDHSDVTVNCGAIVKDAVKGFVWDNQAMQVNPEYPQWGVCKKCKEIAVKSEDQGRQFVIAVIAAGDDDARQS
jgi:hypothetical protein